MYLILIPSFSATMLFVWVWETQLFSVVMVYKCKIKSIYLISENASSSINWTFYSHQSMGFGIKFVFEFWLWHLEEFELEVRYLSIVNLNYLIRKWR